MIGMGLRGLNGPKRSRRGKYLRANQNAERLHGSCLLGPPQCTVSVVSFRDPIQNSLFQLMTSKYKRIGFAKPVLPLASPVKNPRFYNSDGSLKHYSQVSTTYNPVDSTVGAVSTGLEVAGATSAIYSAATGAALFNPYVATGLAVAGAAVGAYSLGKTIYKAIF